MNRSDREMANEALDETILDQDFDEWQADDVYDGLDLDGEEFDEFTGDSHFMLRELDFAGDFDSL